MYFASLVLMPDMNQLSEHQHKHLRDIKKMNEKSVGMNAGQQLNMTLPTK